MAFIPDYVAYLVNRLKKGEDGRVAYERCKGKKPTVMGVEFGEKLLFRRRTGQRMEKMRLQQRQERLRMPKSRGDASQSGGCAEVLEAKFKPGRVFKFESDL